MSLIRKIANGFVFVIGGIVTITVGFFMLRGTMRMWDKNNQKKDSEDEKDNSS